MARKLKPILWRTTRREAECFVLGVEHLPGEWDQLLPKSLLKRIDGVDGLIIECAMLGEERPTEGAALQADCQMTRDFVGEMKRVQKKTGGSKFGSILDMWLVDRMRNSGRLVYQLESLAEQAPAISVAIAQASAFFDVPPPMPPAAARPVAEVVDVEFAERGVLAATRPRKPPRARSPRLREILLERLGSLQQLRQAYLGRDLQLLTQQTNIMWHPASRMMADRNLRMARRLLALLEETPKARYLIGIGVGHLIGAASVIDLMDIGGVPTERVGW
jgi:uncharacterized protein YbaP (TraB family)